MSREERDEAARAIKQPLFTLVNSTKKHLKDVNEERHQAGIDATLRQIHGMASKLRALGYPKTAAFIEKHAQLMPPSQN